MGCFRILYVRSLLCVLYIESLILKELIMQMSNIIFELRGIETPVIGLSFGIRDRKTLELRNEWDMRKEGTWNRN